MKKRIAALAILASASAAWADGIIYDGFNYSSTGTPFLGSGPSGLGGPSGSWVFQGNNSVEPRVVSGSLSYTGVTPYGNSVQLDNTAPTGADGARLFLGNLDKTTTPTLYYSMIISVPSYTATGSSPFIAGFDNQIAGTAYTSFGGLFVRQDGTSANIDLGIGTSGSAFRAFSGALPHDTPLFLVGSFTFQGKSTLDIFQSPTAVPRSAPATHQLTSTNNDASAVTAVSNFFLRGNSGAPQGVKVDELRIGSSWGDIVPHAYYWDTNGTDAGGGGATPSGDWDGSTQNFNTDSTGGTSGSLSATPATLDTVSFSANNEATGTYTVNVTAAQGAGLANIPSGDVTFAGSGTLNVGNYNVAAGASVTLTSTVGGRPGISKTGDGAMTISGPIAFTGSAVVNGGGLSISSDMTTASGAVVSGGTMTLANSQTSVSSILVSGGTLQSPTGAGGGRMIKTAAVLVLGTGKFDLEDNKMITQAAIGSWNAGAYSGVLGLVAAGRNGGAWNGVGIVTGMTDAAGANGLTTLAVATAGDIGKTTFGGQSVATTDTLVMYTYNGDADLSGDITGDDYFRIDQGFASQATMTPLLGYENGDFNFDGKINADDYFIIDSNYSRQGSAFSSAPVLSGVNAVPEPSTFALLATFGLLLRRGRRRDEATKNPSGKDGSNKRVKGVEPSTFTLAT